MTDHALSVREVAEKYSVDPHTVLQWIRTGSLLAINCGRSSEGKKPRWRITAQALRDFELARQAIAAPRINRIRRRRPLGVIDRY